MTADADVALLMARAATLRGDQPEAKRHLDALDSLLINGRGWGLPYAWGTFSSKIPNPIDTIYTYTTAAAVHSHVDYAERFAQPLPTHVLVAVEELDRLWPYYDNQPNDHHPDKIVHNVNALSLAAQYRVNRSVDEKRLGALLAAQGSWPSKPNTIKQVPVAEQCWPYSTKFHKPNDMFHELLLCDGLLHMNSVAQQAATRSILDVWRTHLHGAGKPTRIAYTLGSLLWGPAIAVVVLCRVGMYDEAKCTLALALAHGLYGAEHPRALAWYEVAKAQLAQAIRLSPRGGAT